VNNTVPAAGLIRMRTLASALLPGLQQDGHTPSGWRTPYQPFSMNRRMPDYEPL
jgi:hypothetical protein